MEGDHRAATTHRLDQPLGPDRPELGLVGVHTNSGRGARSTVERHDEDASLVGPFELGVDGGFGHGIDQQQVDSASDEVADLGVLQGDVVVGIGDDQLLDVVAL